MAVGVELFALQKSYHNILSFHCFLFSCSYTWYSLSLLVLLPYRVLIIFASTPMRNPTFTKEIRAHS